MLRAAVMVLAACGGAAKTCPVVPTPTTAVQPFLWKAHKGDGPVVWLYGTYHVMGEADIPVAAWTALDSVPTMLSELGDVEPDRDKTRALALLPSGKGLDQQLPSDDWYDLRDTLRGTVKEEDLARYRPWYASSRLTQKLSPSPDPTMDFALTKRAKARGKKIVALESWEDQLTKLADAFTVADLQQTIHTRKTLACELSQVKAVYATGDLPTMTTLLVIPQTHALVVDRSRAWLPKLEPYFATGGAFVAVGLAHLAGDEGIPKLLEQAGYQVERVPASN